MPEDTDPSLDASATGEKTTEETAAKTDVTTKREDLDAKSDLGDAGKKALDAERRRARDAEKRAKDAEAQLAEVRSAQMSDHEKAIADARAEGAAEAAQKANARLFAAEARALAHGHLADPDLFTDPEVARRLLGFADALPVDDGGEIDAEAISAAIDDLLEKRPSLKASATRPTGSADQGARSNGATRAKTLTEALAAKYGR